MNLNYEYYDTHTHNVCVHVQEIKKHLPMMNLTSHTCSKKLVALI